MGVEEAMVLTPSGDNALPLPPPASFILPVVTTGYPNGNLAVRTNQCHCYKQMMVEQNKTEHKNKKELLENKQIKNIKNIKRRKKNENALRDTDSKQFNVWTQNVFDKYQIIK